MPTKPTGLIEPDETDERLPGLVDHATEAAAGLVSHAAGSVANAGAAAGRLLEVRRRLVAREGEMARSRRLRRLNRSPLPNLYDARPEARITSRRDIGVMTIPVAEVVGTAVDSPAQRGSDFLPSPRLRSANWRGRWQRLLAAQQRLAILPPIDVLQTPEGYWVTDGHNRMALALYGGQDQIDVSVTHLRVPGSEESEVRTGTLEGILADSVQVRAAGEGRLTAGSSLSIPGASGSTPGSSRTPPPGQLEADDRDETGTHTERDAPPGP